MFKNILLATDGSPHAERAANIAADIAATYGATLTIIHTSSLSLSLEDILGAPQAKRFSENARNDIEKMRGIIDSVSMSDDLMVTSIPAPQSAIKELSAEILNDAEQISRNKNVQGIVRVSAMGDPAHEILNQTEKSNIDLIVMGTRGLSNISGLVLGSVSHKIIHLAQCPCLTVK